MFNFSKAEKGQFGGGAVLPSNIVRVSNKNISLGEETINKMGPLSSTASGKVTNLSVEYDAINQALRIKPDPSGWRCWISPSGTAAMHKTGKSIAQLNILMGDYLPHDTEPYVWVLAK